jgi:hypothetical protein
MIVKAELDEFMKRRRGFQDNLTSSRQFFLLKIDV